MNQYIQKTLEESTISSRSYVKQDWSQMDRRSRGFLSNSLCNELMQDRQPEMSAAWSTQKSITTLSSRQLVRQMNAFRAMVSVLIKLSRDVKRDADRSLRSQGDGLDIFQQIFLLLCKAIGWRGNRDMQSRSE